MFGLAFIAGIHLWNCELETFKCISEKKTTDENNRENTFEWVFFSESHMMLNSKHSHNWHMYIISYVPNSKGQMFYPKVFIKKLYTLN